MEGVISLYQQLLLSPKAIGSFQEFLVSFAALGAPAVVLVWLIAILANGRIGGARENLGTWTCAQFAWGWALVIVALVVVIQVASLAVMDRVPDWTAVSPHLALALVAGMVALVVGAGTRREIRQMQRIVDTAAHPAA